MLLNLDFSFLFLIECDLEMANGKRDPPRRFFARDEKDGDEEDETRTNASWRVQSRRKQPDISPRRGNRAYCVGRDKVRQRATTDARASERGGKRRERVKDAGDERGGIGNG